MLGIYTVKNRSFFVRILKIISLQKNLGMFFSGIFYFFASYWQFMNCQYEAKSYICYIINKIENQQMVYLLLYSFYLLLTVVPFDTNFLFKNDVAKNKNF